MLAFLLNALAAKKDDAPPPPSLVDVVKATLVLKGEYGWLAFHVGLFLFCCAMARSLITSQPKIRWLHGLMFLCLTSYGGSTLVPMMLGKPIAMFANEALVLHMGLAWLLVKQLPPFLSVLKTGPGKALSSMGFEFIRCHVMILQWTAAASTLGCGKMPGFSYPVAVVGPLVCGVLGACGGAFFPTDKGLAAVTGDLPWRVQSGIVGSIWLQLLLHDPNVKPLFAGTALADPDWVKIAAIAFFQLVPLLSSQGIFELGANPLAPPPAKGKAKKA